MLSRHSPLARPHGAWPANVHQRPHAQRSAQNRRRAAQSECQDRHPLELGMTDEIKTKKTAPAKETKPHGDKAAARPAADKAPVKPGEPAPSSKPADPGAGAPAPATPTAPTAAELLAEDPNAKKIIKGKGSKDITVRVAHVMATFNNSLVTITDAHGNVLCGSTDGPLSVK